MYACAVCHGDNSREEIVDEVLNLGGRYALVSGVPATVCGNCGERSFSPETTERVRLLVNSPVASGESITMERYEFA